MRGSSPHPVASFLASAPPPPRVSFSPKALARQGDLLALERRQPFLAPGPPGRPAGGPGCGPQRQEGVAGRVERGGWRPASGSPPGPARSAANVKKWELELQTLRESNARLSAALQESAASAEQWKRQFSICRDENDRLRSKVGAGAPRGRGSPFRFSLPAALTRRPPAPAVAAGRLAVAPLGTPPPTFPRRSTSE